MSTLSTVHLETSDFAHARGTGCQETLPGSSRQCFATQVPSSLISFSFRPPPTKDAKQTRWTLSRTGISFSAELMSEPGDSVGLPQEIWDAIIDQLQYDKLSLLQASLTCRALYPRTRNHLFCDAMLSTESGCLRLAKLISLSPKLALLFKYLEISAEGDSIDYTRFRVIESLVNLKHLKLTGGDWSRMPDTIVSSLQSHSYYTFDIRPSFRFRTIGDICSLLRSSPHLVWASFWLNSSFTEECHLDHSLHHIPTPVTLHIGEADPTFPVETLLRLAASSRPCPFSFRNIRTLNIILSSRNAMLRQHLNQYLVLVGRLRLLFVKHSVPVPMYTSSETLDVSNVSRISVIILKCDTNYFGRGSQILEWWIANLSVVKERSTIRSVAFTIVQLDTCAAVDWDDLWTRLDECLASYKMALLERFTLSFDPRPMEWDTYKTHIEGKFPLLKQLRRKIVLK